MNKKSRLLVTDNDPDHPGVIMRYVDPQPGIDFSALAALLFGLGIMAIGVLCLLDWEGNITFVGVFLCLGIGGAVSSGAWKDLAAYCKGLDVWCRVVVEGSTVIFLESAAKEPVRLSLVKIGRIWIKRSSTNGVLSGVYLMAYYDGQELTIANIIKMSRLMGEANEAQLVEAIVAYLNRCRADGEEIQAGYQQDYAANTPVAARDLLEQAPAGVRILLASGVSLVMLLFFFIPQYPATGVPVLFEYPLLIGVVCSLIVYCLAAWQARSCRCRYSDAGALFFWCVVSAGIGVLFQMALAHSIVKPGGFLTDLLALAAIFSVMAGIVYYSFSKCSCGTYPERRSIFP